MAAAVTACDRFAGRTCLVTGGGRGIGRAIAEALAAEGASVGVLARTRSQCEAVAAAIGDRAVPLEADVTDPRACTRAIAELERRFGPPTVVVNAAGISPVRERAELHDPDTFQEILRVNAGGPQTVLAAAAPSLLSNGGAVVNVASVLGRIPAPRLSGYGASKAALIHLSRTLAREWADRGVRVNVLCPGYVETDLTRRMLAVGHIREEVLSQTPLARLATLEEIVSPVLFLLSPEASYITGATLLVDGGMGA
jgi:NAD(P)-dependent dehydrogenase (short-subunit alcohol dehydrogenase family)